jgi:zinc transport system permease protein
MLEIFQYEFMQRAFLSGTLVAIVAPLVGLFLIVRRYSGLADTISHISLVGVATSLFFGLTPIPVSIALSTFCAYFIDKLKDSKRVFGESALAIFTYASLGLVSIIISLGKGFRTNLSSFLFGSVLTITVENLYYIIPICLVVLVCIIVFYRKFFVVSFDLELAKISGIRVGIWNLLLIFLACLVISSGILVVGGLLIGALMIIPAVTALQYKSSFKNTLILSSVIATFSLWIGIFASYYLNLPAGGVIVMVNIIVFVLSIAITEHR